VRIFLQNLLTSFFVFSIYNDKIRSAFIEALQGAFSCTTSVSRYQVPTASASDAMHVGFLVAQGHFLLPKQHA
jgi:hypothetical protein